MTKTTKKVSKPVSNPKAPKVPKKGSKVDFELQITTTREVKPPIAEIAEPFGNGELNMLRDKLNEVIREINK